MVPEPNESMAPTRNINSVNGYLFRFLLNVVILTLGMYFVLATFKVVHGVHLGPAHIIRKRSLDNPLRILLYYDESVYRFVLITIIKSDLNKNFAHCRCSLWIWLETLQVLFQCDVQTHSTARDYVDSRMFYASCFITLLRFILFILTELVLFY